MRSLKAKVAAAREATLAAAQVTQFLVRQVQWMVGKAADRLAPVIADRISQPAETPLGARAQKIAGSETARQAVTAVKAGVRGALVVIEGVEAAGIVRLFAAWCLGCFYP